MAEWERPSLSSGAPRFRKRHRRLRAVMTIVLVAAVGGFGWLAWSAYQEGRISGGDGVVPFLRADTAPTRIRPDDPGGMPVPNQDKAIYNELDPRRAPPKGVERLLPPPEAPVTRPAAVAAPKTPPSLPTLGETAPPPPAREVATVAPHTVAEPSPHAPAAQSATPAPSPFRKVEAPPAQVASTAPSAPPPTPAAKSTAPAAAGGVRVQLGAVSSEGDAQKEWERIRRANGDLLGRLSPNIVRADLGAKGVVYRIQAGPLASADAAADLCGKLKTRNVGCFVAR